MLGVETPLKTPVGINVETQVSRETGERESPEIKVTGEQKCHQGPHSQGKRLEGKNKFFKVKLCFKKLFPTFNFAVDGWMLKL